MADSAAMTMTRRALLRGAVGVVALAAAGCRRHRRLPSAPALTPADAVAVQAAYDAELALLAAYDAGSASGDPAAVQIARSTHEAHLTALRDLLPPGDGSASPNSTPVLSGDMSKAEDASAVTLRTAAVAAADGRAAALLASIAASHRSIGQGSRPPRSSR
jgi:hypothetical protein